MQQTRNLVIDPGDDTANLPSLAGDRAIQFTASSGTILSGAVNHAVKIPGFQTTNTYRKVRAHLPDQGHRTGR